MKFITHHQKEHSIFFSNLFPGVHTCMQAAPSIHCQEAVQSCEESLASRQCTCEYQLSVAFKVNNLSIELPILSLTWCEKWNVPCGGFMNFIKEHYQHLKLFWNYLDLLHCSAVSSYDIIIITEEFKNHLYNIGNFLIQKERFSAVE